MRTLQSKSGDVWRVTGQGVAHFGRAWYIRVTEWNSTMSGATAEVRWTMCRLVSLLDTKTGLGSQSVHSLHDLILTHFHKPLS